MSSEVKIQVRDRDDISKWTPVDKWQSYSVDHNIFNDCGTFSLTPTPSEDIFRLFKYPGQQIQIWCNGALQMSGIVDEVSSGESAKQGKFLTVTGRDMVGLLVDSAAAPISLGGKSALQVIFTMVAPWYPDYIKGITSNNAINFHKMTSVKVQRFQTRSYTTEKKVTYQDERGRTVTHNQVEYHTETTPVGQWTLETGGKISLNSLLRAQPVWKPTTYYKIRGGKNSKYFRGIDDTIDKRVTAGTRVQEVLKKITQQVACMQFCTSDAELLFAKPRYNEQPYGKLLFTWGHNGNVRAVTRNVSIANRHSIISATGSGRKNSSEKGRAIWKKDGTVDPSPAFWKLDANNNLVQRLYKPTILMDRKGSRTQAMLRRMVRRTMEENYVKSFAYQWQIEGHIDSASDKMWAPDACVEIHDEVHDHDGLWYIAGRRFLKNDQGTTTVLTLIPANIWLIDSEDMNDSEYIEYMQYRVKV